MREHQRKKTQQYIISNKNGRHFKQVGNSRFLQCCDKMGPWSAKLESPSLAAYFFLLTLPTTQIVIDLELLQYSTTERNAELQCLMRVRQNLGGETKTGETGRGGCYEKKILEGLWVSLRKPVVKHHSPKAVDGTSSQQRYCVQHKAILLQALLCWLKKKNSVSGGEAGKAWRSPITI